MPGRAPNGRPELGEVGTPRPRQSARGRRASVVLYLGVFPTALAFTTWAYTPARTTATRMGATTYAVPALVVMSWLALDEVPEPLTPAGGVLCLAGVAVSRSGPRPARVVAAEPRTERAERSA
ncbi:DMT family transporter [Streptomyces sp. TRM68367]|uniref:DMT family transporter n=1 Tax=Streptomyces sp. TRM68367 TaxID=2758415 RepID=UPI0021CF97D3|nr:DMT family transporter [Streptomyces sp. TRM68367]